MDTFLSAMQHKLPRLGRTQKIILCLLVLIPELAIMAVLLSPKSPATKQPPADPVAAQIVPGR